MLVDEGKAAVGRPRHEHLPGFQLNDPVGHARDHRPRPAHAPGRPAERRLPLVRPATIRRRRSCAACGFVEPAYSAAIELHLSEHHVRGGRPGDRGRRAASRGTEFDPDAHLRPARHDTSRWPLAAARTAQAERRLAADLVDGTRARHRERRAWIRSPRQARSGRASPTWRNGCASSSTAVASARRKQLIKPGTFARALQAADDGPVRRVVSDARGSRSRIG